MAFTDYCRNLFGRRNAGTLSVVQIVADIGASGAVTLDANDSSPEVTITLTGTGTYNITFPACETVAVLGAHSLLAALTGSNIHFGALSAAGTGNIECSLTPGTAAEPASGTRFFITLLCGQN